MYWLTWFYLNDYRMTKLYYTRGVDALSKRDIRHIGDGAWVTILTFLYYMYCSDHSLSISLNIYMGSGFFGPRAQKLYVFIY